MRVDSLPHPGEDMSDPRQVEREAAKDAKIEQLRGELQQIVEALSAAITEIGEVRADNERLRAALKDCFQFAHSPVVIRETVRRALEKS
jgi:hypothetical protein